MELARSIAGLLSWQWLVLILAFVFYRPLLKLINRVVGFSLGGEKGLSATLSTGPVGRIIEGNASEPEKTRERVDARLFVLRDESGRERAKLGVTDTGATSLTLYDPQEKERLSIFVLADGSSTVALYDDQKIRIMLSHSEMMGVEGLSILGPDRKNGIYLLVSSEGHPSFDISDQRGMVVFSA
ncbi:MAG: hypothetical protein WBQ86_10460 [Candidatus Binatus sp.]